MDCCSRNRRGRHGDKGPSRLQGHGRIEPAAPEDRVAQPPRIGMFSVSDPGAHARIDIVNIDCSGPPLVAQAAQTIAETPHIVVRKAAMPVVIEHEAEELRRLAARRDKSLARVKLEPPANKIALDPRSPIATIAGSSANNAKSST